MRLNRHVPVGTHGDVRGRLFKENLLLVYRKNAKSATIKPIGNTMIFPDMDGRGRRIRTLGTRFWRPLLYQLSYAPI